MPHFTTNAQATLPQTPAHQHSPVQTSVHSKKAYTDTAPKADVITDKLSDVVAALHAHEAQRGEQQRRSNQALLQARQRFD